MRAQDCEEDSRPAPATRAAPAAGGRAAAAAACATKAGGGARARPRRKSKLHLPPRDLERLLTEEAWADEAEEPVEVETEGADE